MATQTTSSTTPFPAGSSPASAVTANPDASTVSPANSSSPATSQVNASPPASLTTSSTTPPTTSPLSSVISIATSSTSSGGTQKAKNSQSTTTAHSSASSSLTPTTNPSATASPSNRLSNGAVAGIVVGVALGLALLTFLATFVIMRRQQRSKGKRRYPPSKDSGGFELNTPRQQDSTPIPKKPFTTEASGVSGTYENYLPQSADDRTIQQKAKAILDQIELHVENYYRNSSSSASRPDNAELAVFDSPYLPASLASLLPRSKNRVNIMKHALAQSITSSISPSASPARSLLPNEYALLPNTITSARSSVSTKAGEYPLIPREITKCQTVANSTKDPPKSCLDGV